jgi:glutathione reductase (NADPH)
MAETFDLIVIGSGAGGSRVAKQCSQVGWRVAIVDSRPFGGTCALRGCDPKKVLVSAAEAVDAARRLADKGVEGPVQIRWRDLMRFKRSFTEPVTPKREQELAEAGIETLRGVARFVGPTALEIDGTRVEASHVHIATGSRPAELPIRGAEHLTTSDQFLELDELPRRIVFLGSGYIAFELAHVSATAGASVTMLEMLAQPLAGFDPDLVSILVERTRALGVELRLETRVEAIERRAETLVVRASSGSGPVNIEADLVVHSAGRVPDLGDLALERAGVAYDEQGIIVNEYLQSVSNASVYAAGDVAKGGLPLTPVASFEARVVAENLIEGNRRKADYPPIPSVVFTLPPLASVGLHEREAKDRGLDFDVRHERTSSWQSSRRVGEPSSGYKLLVERKTGKLLGAHLLGPRAEELINLFAMAIRCELTSTEIRGMIFAYPTLASDMQDML